jgi:hypothetical protein
MLSNPEMAIDKAIQHFHLLQDRDEELEGECMYSVDLGVIESNICCSSTLLCDSAILPGFCR